MGRYCNVVNCGMELFLAWYLFGCHLDHPRGAMTIEHIIPGYHGIKINKNIENKKDTITLGFDYSTDIYRKDTINKVISHIHFILSLFIPYFYLFVFLYLYLLILYSYSMTYMSLYIFNSSHK